MNNIDLFGNEINDTNDNWRNHYVGMPEYNNFKAEPAEVIATFKFRNKDDFEKFMDVVKTNLYDNKRVFDGKQKKNDYSAWYPLDSRPSEHIYIFENEK
jgi:hypothetical protein